MYYLIINEHHKGPFTREELLAQGLTPTTMVWRDGMADWLPANEVAELQDLLYQQPQSQPTVQPGQQQYPQYPQYPQPQYPQQPRQQYPQQPRQPQQYQPYTNWQGWAIVATVFGLCSCIGLVLGIIAITKAVNANKFYQMGDTVNGNVANASARSMTIAALIFDGIGLLGSLIMLAS